MGLSATEFLMRSFYMRTLMKSAAGLRFGYGDRNLNAAGRE